MTGIILSVGAANALLALILWRRNAGRRLPGPWWLRLLGAGCVVCSIPGQLWALVYTPTAIRRLWLRRDRPTPAPAPPATTSEAEMRVAAHAFRGDNVVPIRGNKPTSR